MSHDDRDTIIDELDATAARLHQVLAVMEDIHQQAADMTYRCACDECRLAWARVTRLARDASQCSATMAAAA